MKSLPDAGVHLVRTADLTFSLIDDPEQAVETAVAVIRLILGHVEPKQRLKVGCELIGRALS